MTRTSLTYEVRVSARVAETVLTVFVRTRFGEDKAAAVAAHELSQRDPDFRYGRIEVFPVETVAGVDPRRTFDDPWG